VHDPLVVAFEIPRPWPQRTTFPASANGKRWAVRLHHDHHDDCPADCAKQPFPWWRLRSYSKFWRLAGLDFYWAPLVTVWHREPRGHDSGEVCPHYRRWQDPESGQWRTKTLRRWRWHVHHWKVQVPPLQEARRRLLTRCAWCGGRSRRRDAVNVSHSWDGPRGRWWHGEPGLYHHDCSTVENAHRMCLCETPALTGNGGYGTCGRCGRFRAWRAEPGEADRLLAALPPRSRIPADLRPRLEALWAERRKAAEIAEAAAEPDG
jgi:hypothetical protein